MFDKSIILGIDPGKSGGWACYKFDGTVDVGIMPLSGDEVNVSELAIYLKNFQRLEKVLVVIEKVHSMPKQGVASTFSFGTSYGKLLGMCQTLGVSYELVIPQTWKKDILFGTDKDKNAAVAYVDRFWPSIETVPQGCRKPHLGIVDAVCIMAWGVKKYVEKA